MCKSNWVLKAVCAAFCLAVLGEAFADDVLPPCWRGQAGSTYQQWKFDSGANPAAPELVSNPYGSPSAAMNAAAGGGAWIDQLYIFGTTRSNIWDLGAGGTMTLTIPNNTCSSGCWKVIWVQVTQFHDSSFYLNNAAVSIPGATRLGGQVVPLETVNADFGMTCVVDQSMWLVESCPDSETITITGAQPYGSAIDSVIVDTLCTSGDTGDVQQPCWRGRPGTTLQNWSFHNSSNPASPEHATNPNPGTPSATIALGSQGTGWKNVIANTGCRQGYWDLGKSGTITLGVPNSTGSGGSYKYIVVQVAQYKNSAYSDWASVAITGGATLVGTNVVPLETGLPGGGSWQNHQSTWRVAPSPASEQIVVTASPTRGALVDQVVVDTLSLDFACPGTVTGVADPDLCSKANVSWTTPAVDGCVVTNVTSSPANNSTFTVGSTPVTSVIWDLYGGTKTCSFNVVISDTQLPTVNCPAEIVVARDPSQCGAVVSFTVTAMDNCSVTNISCTPASGSLFPPGTNIVTCFSQDASGNSSVPCSFMVKVVDYTGDALPPCWRGQPNTTFQQWAFSSSDNPASPELFTNPNAGLLRASMALGSQGTGWKNRLLGFGCKQGYWDLGKSGTITLDVPNSALPAGSYKHILVQVTQFKGLSGVYSELATVSIAGGATLMSTSTFPLETVPGGSWQVHQSVWRTAPSPASEQVVVTASATKGALVDQVVVDTRSVNGFSPAGTPTVGTQTECDNVTFVGGSSYTWDLADATGGAGTGSDLLNLTGTGTIDVQSAGGNPFTIKVNSPPGGPSNFDPHQSYNWTIATTGGGILDFDTTKVTVNSSGFQGSLAGDVIAVKTSGNDLVLYLLHPPVVTNVAFTRPTNMTWKIKVSDLLANAAPRDVGDTLSLVSVSGGTCGTVGLIAGGTWVGYAPTSPDQNLTDSFTYTVEDNNNGLQSSGTVTLNVIAQQPGQATGITVVGGTATVTFAGIPGYTYDVQRSATVDFAMFDVVLTTNTPASGVFTFVDTTELSTAYYRLNPH